MSVARHNSPRQDPVDLRKFGPRLEVRVGLPLVPVAGHSRSHSSPTDFSDMPALIDTGAGRTALTPAAVERLKLPLVNYTTLSRAGGMSFRVPVHVASIQFPRNRLGTIEIIEVACCDLGAVPIQCVLGRDVLSRWLFTYDGKLGKWWIEEEDIIVAWVEPPEGIY